MGLVFLECKLQQDTYGSDIFNSKCQKTVEKWYLKANKQQPSYRWCF